MREDYVMNQLDNSHEFGWDIEEIVDADDFEDGFYIHLHGDMYNEVPYRTENDAYQDLEQIIRDDAFSISDDELKEMFGREEPESDGEAQYKEYTEDGGEEYKETLIRWDKDDGDDFYDPHYDGQDNTLLSIRSKIRRDDFGNKVLFLEEVQSDWHQQGRKEGYDNPPLKGRLFQKR